MEDKYYVPKIEEFRVGFEYEMVPSKGFAIMNYDEPNQSVKIDWATDYEKGIYGVKSVNLLGDGIKQGIKDKKCRVRFLNREDIESLGFEFLPKKSLGNLTHRYEIKGLYNRIDNSENGDDTMWQNVYLMHFPDRNRVFIEGDISCGSTNEKFFEGEIKNKSELEVLLQQLNIK